MRREAATTGPGVGAGAAVTEKGPAAGAGVEAEAGVEVEVEGPSLSKPHCGQDRRGSGAGAWLGELCDVGAHTSSYHCVSESQVVSL